MVGERNGRKDSKDGSVSGRRNIERERGIHYTQTGKKERLGENVETQNTMRQMKKYTIDEKKSDEEMDVKQKLGQTSVVMLMVLMFKLLLRKVEESQGASLV